MEILCLEPKVGDPLYCVKEGKYVTWYCPTEMVDYFAEKGCPSGTQIIYIYEAECVTEEDEYEFNRLWSDEGTPTELNLAFYYLSERFENN